MIKGYGIFDDGALSHPFADYHKKTGSISIRIL
jgi:hypothetical protein